MRGVAIAALLLQLSACSPAGPESQPTSLPGAATYVYKSIRGVDLRLHVFNPPQRDHRGGTPAIVFFFGGGWARGSIYQFVPQATDLARRGMVAIIADYRVFARHGTSPFEAIADGKSAIRWVRAHAAQLGVDPDRIAAAGGSAGAHIALSAAVFEAFDEASDDHAISSKPNALVLFSPVVDTSAAEMNEPFGGRGRDASPLQHLGPGLPPTIIFHGTADTIAPFSAAWQFCTDARQRGARCQLIGYEGASHGFFGQENGEANGYGDTLTETGRFLTSLGYLSP